MDALPELTDALVDLLPWLKALLVLLLGWVVARVAAAVSRRVTEPRLDPQLAMIAQRGAYWSILGVAVATALREVGFDLSVLLGAAGILTVALGFASQTSASNLISGLFLVGERPFVVGDTIQIGATVGQVVAIDLLSVKLRTFDNRLVRVPNESLLKTEIVNLTHYRIRRIDLQFQVAHGTDLARLRTVATAVADSLGEFLDEPRPQLSFERFSDSGLTVQLSAWTPRETVVEARNALADALVRALDREGFAVPLPVGPRPIPSTTSS